MRPIPHALYPGKHAGEYRTYDENGDLRSIGYLRTELAEGAAGEQQTGITYVGRLAGPSA